MDILNTLKSTFEYLPYSSLITNNKGVILAGNRAFFTYCDFEPENIIHKPLEMIFPDIKEIEDFYEKDISYYSGNITVPDDFFPEARVFLTLSRITGDEELVTVSVHLPVKAEGESPCRQGDGNAVHSDLLINNFDMYSYIAHELATPINAVLGFSTILLDRSTVPEDVSYLRLIKNSAKYLLNTTDNFLDFAKILRGKFKLKKIKFLLVHTLNYVFNLFKITAQEKKIDYMIIIDNNVPNIVFGDEQRMSQIVINLLSNSFKYTQNNGTVLIRCQYVDNKLVLVVSDTGIGIPKEKLNNIFKPFQQLETEIENKRSGAGLGLTITQKLVEFMEGTIEVNSTYGQGSTFIVRLPVHDNPEEIEELEAEPDVDVGELDIVESWLRNHKELAGHKDIVLEGLKELPEKIAELEKAVSEKDIPLLIHLAHKFKGFTGCYGFDELYAIGEEIYEEAKTINYDIGVIINKLNALKIILMKIPDKYLGHNPYREHEGEITELLNPVEGVEVLLADDSVENLKLLQSFLHEINIHCVTVTSGKMVIDLLNQEEFSIIVMDLHMPIMDGFTAVKKIRERYTSEELVVIAMTAENLESMYDKAIEAGFNDCFNKSIEKNALHDKILQIIAELKK